MASIFRGLPTKQVTLLHQDGRVTPRQKSLINDKGNYIMIILEGGPDLIQAGDRIEVDGKFYTINGEPKAWKGATGRVSHMQLNIERWQG